MPPPRTAVRLDHARAELARVTVIDWCVTSVCNYACSYCPARLHDGAARGPDLDVATHFSDAAIDHYAGLGRSTFFQFSGGEPTAWRHLLDLARHLRGRGARAGVISNAARPLHWWEAAAPSLDQAVLSFHVESADPGHFAMVAGLLARSVRTHVNVPMHPERFDACIAAARLFAERCPDVTLTLKPLLVGFGQEMYAYTPEQRRLMRECRPEPRRTRPLSEVRGLMRVTYDDGTAETKKPADLIVAGENRWPGWRCAIGLELLSVDLAGRVHRGVCRQGGTIGHIADGSLRFPTEGVVCGAPTCHCATDIMTTRSRE